MTPRPKGKCYLVGPMRGYPEFNFPAFLAAAEKLRKKGWTVLSPAEHDIELCGGDYAKATDTEHPALNFREVIAWDLAQVAGVVDCVFVLPGWEVSTGARMETKIAFDVQIPVYEFETGNEIEAVPPLPAKAVLDFGPEWRAEDPETGGNKGRKQAVFANMSIIAQVYEARVHGFGVQKYPDEHGAPNWSRGMPWSWFYDAALRHIFSYWAGEDLNPESGLPHLAHARWMLSNLIEYAEYGLGTDDRPKWRQR